jgi:hypothetical protein
MDMSLNMDMQHGHGMDMCISMDIDMGMDIELIDAISSANFLHSIARHWPRYTFAFSGRCIHSSKLIYLSLRAEIGF